MLAPWYCAKPASARRTRACVEEDDAGAFRKMATANKILRKATEGMIHFAFPSQSPHLRTKGRSFLPKSVSVSSPMCLPTALSFNQALKLPIVKLKTKLKHNDIYLPVILIEPYVHIYVSYDMAIFLLLQKSRRLLSQKNCKTKNKLSKETAQMGAVGGGWCT